MIINCLEYIRSRDNSMSFHKNSSGSIDPSTLSKVRLTDLEWRACLYSTDCSETGLVLLRGSGCLKRFSKQKIKNLAKEAQVLKEKDLMKSSRPSTCVPQILYTFADQIYTGMFLNACIACPISLTLHSPLDEPSVKLCAASVVAALEDLHKIGVLFRGVSPDVLMFDRTGHLQLSGLQVWEEIVWGKSIYHMWDDRLFSSRNSPRERPWSSC